MSDIISHILFRLFLFLLIFQKNVWKNEEEKFILCLGWSELTQILKEMQKSNS